MIALLGFILTISIMVIIHEFGHYLVARWFKVKILTFAIGFGPKLIQWQTKSNHWRIGLIPLGGYVQMLDGRDQARPLTAAEQPYAFNGKPAYQKILIAAAGPLFNILFAFMAYYCLGLYGVYQLRPIIVSSNPSPAVANLSQIKPNSLIRAINQQAPTSWSEAETIFQQQLTLTHKLTFTLEPVLTSEKNATTQGNKPPLQQLNLDLKTFSANNDHPSLNALGLAPVSYLPLVSYIEPQSPAAAAGLQLNDRIVQINAQPTEQWDTLAQIIRSNPSNKLNLTIRRKQHLYHLSIIPEAVTDDNGQIIGKIGIMPTLNQQLLAQNSFIKRYSLVGSFAYAWQACEHMLLANVQMLSLMLQGKVSWHNISGPVTIAQTSAVALNQSFNAFVDLLAMISLSLAVMNLLPIPALDGGHIVLYALEWWRGKGLDLSTQQFLFKLGFGIIIGLSFLALYNDFLRLFNL